MVRYNHTKLHDFGLHGMASSDLYRLRNPQGGFRGHSYVIGKFHRMLPEKAYQAVLRDRVRGVIDAGLKWSSKRMGTQMEALLVNQRVLSANPPAVLVFEPSMSTAREADLKLLGHFRQLGKITGAPGSPVSKGMALRVFKNMPWADFQLIGDADIRDHPGKDWRQGLSEPIGQVTMNKKDVARMWGAWGKAPKKQKMLGRADFNRRWMHRLYMRRLGRLLGDME